MSLVSPNRTVKIVFYLWPNSVPCSAMGPSSHPNWTACFILFIYFPHLSWKLLLVFAATSVCQMCFSSRRWNETQVKAFKWKTNYKWDLDCWRLYWHFQSCYIQFKGFGVCNRFARLWEWIRDCVVWWILCGLQETDGLIFLCLIWNTIIVHSIDQSGHWSSYWSVWNQLCNI